MYEDEIRETLENLESNSFGTMVMLMRLYDVIMLDGVSATWDPDQRVAGFVALSKLHAEGGTNVDSISLRVPDESDPEV